VLDSRVAIACVSALLGAAIALGISALVDDSGQPSRDGEASISFEPGPAADVAAIQSSGAFQRAVSTVNHELGLPTDLRVQVVGPETAARVGIEGPTYIPKDRTVYFPWSFVSQSRDDLRTLSRFNSLSPEQIDQRLAEAMTFVLYHELSHGLVDVLDVPVVASPEETADSLASIFAIATSRGGQVVPLSASALDEALAKKQRIPTLADYADDHGFSRQRAFNALCLVYGSDPSRYANIVDSGLLPKARADICHFEYQDDLRSWRRLLSAYLTRTGGLLPLR
jgi:hypothetical protein